MFCPKCGKEISDESQFCNYCGYEIETEFLDKKNTQNEETKTAEFKSETINKPKSARLKKRTLFIMTSGMVIAFIAIFLCLGVGNNEEKGYFQDTTWGMSAEQVKKILPENVEEKVFDSQLKILTINTNEYEGINLDSGGEGAITYSFKDDSLNMVTVMLAVNGNKADDYENAFIKTFNQRYGDYSIDENGNYEWESKKSSISLMVNDINLGSFSIRDFVIFFTDNSKQKAEI